MDKYGKLLSNTFIIGLGTFSSKILVFLMMPLYTAYLSTGEFGDAELISQSANLLMPLVCIGICDAIFRFTFDREIDKKTVFSSGIGIIIFSSVAFFAVMLAISFFFDSRDSYNWLIFLYVISANLHLACAQFLRACGHIKLFAVQGIIGTVLTIAFNILFLIGFSMGVVGYVLSVVVADILVTAFLIFYAKLYNSFDIKKISTKLLKQMLKYSIPMIPTSVFWWVTNVSDRFLVDRICGESINGLYSAAYKIPTIITLICVVFIEAWQFSIMSDAEEKERSEFFGRVFDSFLSISFFACSGLIVLSKILSRILFNESYFSAWQYIPILLLSTVFAGMVTFMGSVYVLRKKSIMSFITSAIGAFVNILLNVLLIPVWGAQGAAVATFASYFIVYIIRMLDTRRFIHFDTHNFKVLLNIIITTVQALIMVFEIRYWVLWELLIILLITAVNAGAIIRGIRIAFGIVIKKIKK